MNIFRGLSKGDVVAVVVLGSVLALLAVVLIMGLVSLLPITDKQKFLVLGALGICSLIGGYLTLKRMPPKNQQANPAPIKPTGHSQDCCSPVREKNRNLSHAPTIPKTAITISRVPTARDRKTTIALPILPSIKEFLSRYLHYVL
jgi:hypothetical protein